MTNPTNAVSSREPSRDRLMTPAFSVMVSPKTAKRIGGEAASTEAMRIEISILHPVRKPPLIEG
jgi:hypothetical protein